MSQEYEYSNIMANRLINGSRAHSLRLLEDGLCVSQFHSLLHDD